jgi:hypothetical protein
MFEVSDFSEKHVRKQNSPSNPSEDAAVKLDVPASFLMHAGPEGWYAYLLQQLEGLRIHPSFFEIDLRGIADFVDDFVVDLALSRSQQRVQMKLHSRCDGQVIMM